MGATSNLNMVPLQSEVLFIISIYSFLQVHVGLVTRSEQCPRHPTEKDNMFGFINSTVFKVLTHITGKFCIEQFIKVSIQNLKAPYCFFLNTINVTKVSNEGLYLVCNLLSIFSLVPFLLTIASKLMVFRAFSLRILYASWCCRASPLSPINR